VFAHTPEAHRTWAGREVDAHGPDTLTMLSEGRSPALRARTPRSADVGTRRAVG
jgi:hypothetical protein